MSSSKRPPSRFAARRDGRRTHLRADFPPTRSSSSVPPCRFRHAGSAGYRARHSSGSANRRKRFPRKSSARRADRAGSIAPILHQLTDVGGYGASRSAYIALQVVA
ncbi:uncharacterized protein SOCE836_039370 [Sorangium cellulosum]|uniref:Uncharacterized protein n=1 Tax=Sorangium cellulosum TaxID=56 RepID=A0A4P2QNU3_SORCE|nr:uncharacterized protein SOCE836_039370 [Sorangium cellulosum]